MNEPFIRHVKPIDYPPIIAVIDEWWSGRPMSHMLPKLFFVHFQNTSFVAELDGRIVGFLVGFISQTVREEAYIHFVGVHPDFRKNGLGKSLYDRFFSTVNELRCHTVRCVTSPVNKGSIAFHHCMGFSAEANEKVIDGMPIFEGYDGRGEDRVLFVKKLTNTID